MIQIGSSQDGSARIIWHYSGSNPAVQVSHLTMVVNQYLNKYPVHALTYRVQVGTGTHFSSCLFHDERLCWDSLAVILIQRLRKMGHPLLWFISSSSVKVYPHFRGAQWSQPAIDPPTVKWMALFSSEKVSNFTHARELFKSLKSIFH